jgi:hypothetical protein
VDPGTTALLGEHPCSVQNLQMVADRGLAAIEYIDEVARADLGTGTSSDQAEQTKSDGIGEHFENCRQLQRVGFVKSLSLVRTATSEFHNQIITAP